MYKKKQSNAKKFRRQFNTKIIRAKQTYSFEEIAHLLNVHINTVHAWYKTGLRKIDDQKPYLVFGKDLMKFLNAKTNQHRVTLQEKFSMKYDCLLQAKYNLIKQMEQKNFPQKNR